MTIPTLVIGVGGTGLKVLLRVKERFLEAYDTLPDNVTLLEIDTDEYKGEDFNQVSLLRDEFFHVATQNRNQRIDTIYARKNNGEAEWQWVNEVRLRRTLTTEQQQVIMTGAGTVRPVGRSALFLRSRDVYNQIHDNVMKVTQQYDHAGFTPNSTSNEIPKANIFVVASVAGGSGSGMVLDILRILQYMRKQGMLDESKIYVNALLVGGAAFGNDVEARTHSNTLAALRELERLGAVAAKLLNASVPPVMQLPSPIGRFEGNVTPADAVFLFDRPNRLERDSRIVGSKNPAESFLEFVIAPTLADMILAFADEKINLRINTVETDFNSNLKTKDPYKPDKVGYYPYLSAGTYTFIFPERDIRRSAGFRLLGEFWRDYMVRDKESSDGQDLTITANLWGKDLDAKTPMVTPEMFVTDGLSQSHVGNNINNNQFIQMILSSVKKKELSIAEGKPWWKFWGKVSMIQRVLNLVGLPQDVNLDNREITQEITSLERDIDKSIQIDLLSKCRSVYDVKAWRQQYLGEGISSNDDVPQGEWLQWLRKKSYFIGHANEFRQVLQQVIKTILNDRDTNNQLLPYRVEYSQHVLNYLEQKILVVKVGKKEANQEITSLIGDYFKNEDAKVIKNRNEMISREDRANQNQDFQGYLKATKAYAEARKETVGKELLIALCDILLEQVQETQNALAEWKKQLSIIGTKMGELESDHDRWRETKDKIPVRMYVTDAVFEETLYAKHKETALKSLVTGIKWVSQTKGFVLNTPFAPHIGMEIEPKIVAEQAINWAGTKDGPFRNLGDEQEVNLATRIKDHLIGSYTSLANLLVKEDNIAALIPLKNFESRQRLYHVLGLHQTVANDPIATQYYDKVYQTIVGQLQKADYYRISDGYIKDPENHRHTIAMEIAIGFKLEHHRDYEEYIKTYRKDINNFYALHGLIEEDIASIEYEIEFKPGSKLYPGLNLTPLLLDPTIVDILGNKARLELFVKALTFHSIRRLDPEIRKNDQKRGADYYLHLTKTVGDPQTIRLSMMTTPDELRMIANDFSLDQEGINNVTQDEKLINRIRLMYALRTFILYEKEIDNKHILIDYAMVEEEMTHIINGHNLDRRIDGYTRAKENFLNLYRDHKGQYDSLAHLGLVLTNVADRLLQAEKHRKGTDDGEERKPGDII